jgi:hypothetical protein
MIRGRCLLVGGHSRGVGKTALAVALVRALGPRPVATVKVSAHRHGGGHLAIEEDAEPTLATSTGRCLAAGAARAFLCRCPDGHLHEVAALVRVLSSGGYDAVRGCRPDAVRRIVEHAGLESLVGAVPGSRRCARAGAWQRCVAAPANGYRGTPPRVDAGPAVRSDVGHPRAVALDPSPDTARSPVPRARVGRLCGPAASAHMTAATAAVRCRRKHAEHAGGF